MLRLTLFISVIVALGGTVNLSGGDAVAGADPPRQLAGDGVGVGRQRGAEELVRQLNRVFTALVAEAHPYRGSVTGCSGDTVARRPCGRPTW